MREERCLRIYLFANMRLTHLRKMHIITTSKASNMKYTPSSLTTLIAI